MSVRKAIASAPEILFEAQLKQAGIAFEREYRFHDERKWRFDFAIPHKKIAVEIEGGIYSGGRHVRPKGFIADAEKYNTATLMGWKVLRVAPESVTRSETALNMVRALL